MRTPRAALAVAALAVMLVPGSSSAGKPCVAWNTTTPVVSNANGMCSVVSDPFTTRVTDTECFGVPPAGVSSCVTVVVYVP